MTNANYIVTTSVVKVEDDDICSYGISCIFNGKNYYIDDISTEQAVVEQAVDKFNHYELSPQHFKDAVEDLVTEISAI